MEISLNSKEFELEETKIEKVFDLWISLSGQIIDYDLFLITCSKLTIDELHEAKVNLLVHGISCSNYEFYFMSFSKSHGFIGKIFSPKSYKKEFICQGRSIGFPIYYEWVKNQRRIPIPEKTGVYHLFYEGILVYIGFSRCIKNRLKNHYADDNMVFDAVLWFVDSNMKLREWLDFERNLIKYWKPSLNRNFLE
jgi:hypothetical protein